MRQCIYTVHSAWLIIIMSSASAWHIQSWGSINANIFFPPIQSGQPWTLTWSILWFIWNCRMASQRFQNVYSGHRTGWNTRQEWEVWERWGRKRIWFSDVSLECIPGQLPKKEQADHVQRWGAQASWAAAAAASPDSLTDGGRVIWGSKITCL